MTSSSLTLVHRILIVVLVLLIPAAASSQEKSQPTATAPQEKSDDEQPQKPSDTATSEQGRGSLLMPRTEGEAEEKTANQGEANPATSQQGGIYIIKRGDTLWDISNMFFKDPFLWPFIWKANPYITNADLIYPGNKLAIPALGLIERAMQAPPGPQQDTSSAEVLARRRQLQTGPTGTEEEQPSSGKLILPEQEPVPIIDKYSMLNAGFVHQEESRDRIVGSLEGKTIFGYDDIVYVKITSQESPVPGDKFIIYRPLERVKHPVTGSNYGRLIKVLGVLQLTEKGRDDTFTARITLSFDAAEKGSMLTPYQEPMLVYNSSQTGNKDLTGYILEVMDGRTINAQIDIVYLDKGSADGVEAGDRFLIYARGQERAYPRNVIGEAQVFLVKERTATAVVRKSSDTLAKGDPIESKK